MFQATERSATPFELPPRDPTPTDSDLGIMSSGASDAGEISSGVSDTAGMSSAASETGSNVTFRDLPERRKNIKVKRMAADGEMELGMLCFRIIDILLTHITAACIARIKESKSLAYKFFEDPVIIQKGQERPTHYGFKCKK